jgi:hypothetical protein
VRANDSFRKSFSESYLIGAVMAGNTMDDHEAESARRQHGREGWLALLLFILGVVLALDYHLFTFH